MERWSRPPPRSGLPPAPLPALADFPPSVSLSLHHLCLRGEESPPPREGAPSTATLGSPSFRPPRRQARPCSLSSWRSWGPAQTSTPATCPGRGRQCRAWSCRVRCPPSLVTFHLNSKRPCSPPPSPPYPPDRTIKAINRPVAQTEARASFSPLHHPDPLIQGRTRASSPPLHPQAPQSQAISSVPSSTAPPPQHGLCKDSQTALPDPDLSPLLAGGPAL